MGAGTGTEPPAVTCEGALEFLRQIAEACARHPKARLAVWH